MTKRQPSNQELRTRKDLLHAADRLVKTGKKPTMDEVAEEALVSRATAYRYFGNIDDLLAEVPIENVVREPADVFTNDLSIDPEERIDKAEAYIHKVVYENEAQLRIMLASSITRSLEKEPGIKRQNRRAGLIDAALAPARHLFQDDTYKQLCASLSLIFGPEAMIVLTDVVNLDPKTARAVKSWAVRALVRVALASRNTENKRNDVATGDDS
jgi:AcrR family transcriptional regulator